MSADTATALQTERRVRKHDALAVVHCSCNCIIQGMRAEKKQHVCGLAAGAHALIMVGTAFAPILLLTNSFGADVVQPAVKILCYV